LTEQILPWIISGVLILLLVFVVSAIVQIRRTAKSVEDFLKTTQESLNPLLKELRESVERANRVTAGLESSVNDVQHLSKAIGEAGSIINELNKLIRQSGLAFSIKTASLGVGIKTALNVLAKGIMKKRG
jgi:uncharacterized protein YoxC